MKMSLNQNEQKKMVFWTGKAVWSGGCLCKYFPDVIYKTVLFYLFCVVPTVEIFFVEIHILKVKDEIPFGHCHLVGLCGQCK